MHGRALRELKIKIIAPLTSELLTKQPFVSSWFLLFTIGKLCLPTVFETIYSSTAFQCLQALQNMAAQKREKNHFFSTFWLLLFTFDDIANIAGLLPRSLLQKQFIAVPKKSLTDKLASSFTIDYTP